MYKLQNCHVAFKRGYSRDKTNGGPSADARADRRLLLIVSTDLQSSITGTAAMPVTLGRGSDDSGEEEGDEALYELSSVQLSSLLRLERS